MSKLYLVTGGAGFIGSHLIETLTAQGNSVRVLDDFSTGLRDNLAHVHPAPVIIQGSLTDAATVNRAVAGAEVVFHLGALASVQASVESPLESHAICATGTVHVLDAARRSGVRRVVFAASASAYGLPTSNVQTEEEQLQPLSPYAAAKLASEMYLQAFSASYGLETVRLRFFNIFGPRQRPDSPYSGVISIFTAAMSKGKTPLIFGDGLQSRDFTYVADVVQALQKAAEKPGVSGCVYNVGTGSSVNLLELIAALNKLLGKDLVAKHAPERAGDIRHSRADISRIRRELGYEPTVPFEEGLRRTLEWYRATSR